MELNFPGEMRAAAGNPLYNHYQCKDGQWIALAHLDPDRYWPKLCRALQMEDIQSDPRFMGVAARGRNARELVASSINGL